MLVSSDGGLGVLEHLDVVLKHGLGLLLGEILNNFKGNFVIIASIVEVVVLSVSCNIFDEGHSWVLLVSIYVDLSHFDIVWYLEFLVSDFVLALHHLHSVRADVGLFLSEVLNNRQSGLTMVCGVFNIYVIN